MSRPYSVAHRILTVVASLLAITVVLTPSAAHARPVERRAAPASGINWHSCHKAFECAVVRVPLDYDHPQGPTTPLSLVRLPATDKAHRVGSVFLNPGGPGGSGVNMVLTGGSMVSSLLKGRFDIVGWDLRGTYRSAGLRCFDTQAKRDATFPPFAFPRNRHQLKIQHHADLAFSRACVANGRPIVDHMTTGDHARDLDRLRAAVGDKQLTYFGASYGSVLGTTYANLYPDRVRALVVDSVLDPVSWTTGKPGENRLPVFAREGSARASARTLDHFFESCDAAATDTDNTTNCSFGPNAERRYFKLGAQLKRQAMTVPGPAGPMNFGYAELEATTLPYLYEVGAWGLLADFLSAIEGGGSQRMAKLEHWRASVQQKRYDDYIEANRAITCADADTATTTAAYAAAGRTFERRYPGIGGVWAWIDSNCASFPGDSSDRYTGPWNARTANPVLVVGTRFDPALPLSNATALGRRLPGSRVLTLDGVGHGSFIVGGSGCINAAIAKYLGHKTLPPRGKVCAQDTPPFTAGPQGLRSNRWSVPRVK